MWTKELEKLFQDAMDEYNEEPTLSQIQSNPKYKVLGDYKHFDHSTFELRVLEEKGKRLKKRYADKLTEEAASSKAKARALKSGYGFSLRRRYTGTLAKMLSKLTTKKGKTAAAGGSEKEDEPLLKLLLSEVKAAVGESHRFTADAGTTSTVTEPVLQQILFEVKQISKGMEVLVNKLTHD